MNAEERAAWNEIVELARHSVKFDSEPISARLTAARACAILAVGTSGWSPRVNRLEVALAAQDQALAEALRCAEAAEQRAAVLDCALTEMCARVEIAEQRVEEQIDEVRAVARLNIQAASERANALVNAARVAAGQRAADAEHKTAAWRRAAKAWEARVADLRPRAEAAEAALAEMEERWLVMARRAYSLDEVLRVLRQRDGAVINAEPAQELSALRTVAEAALAERDAELAALLDYGCELVDALAEQDAEMSALREVAEAGCKVRAQFEGVQDWSWATKGISFAMVGLWDALAAWDAARAGRGRQG